MCVRLVMYVFQVQVRKRAQANDKGTDEATNKSQRQKLNDQEVSIIYLFFLLLTSVSHIHGYRTQ